MRPVFLAALLFMSLSASAFGQTAPKQDKPAPVKKADPPKQVAASPDDLAILETVFSDLVSDKDFRAALHSPSESGNDKIVVVSDGLENFKPKNDKIILSDLKAFGVELKKARAAPNYIYLTDCASF